MCGFYHKNVDGFVDLGLLHSPGGGGGEYLAKFNTGGSAPRSSPLPFYIPFWQKRYLFYIPFIKKRYPFSHACFTTLHPFYTLVIKSLNEQYYGRISRIRGNAISASIPFRAEPPRIGHYREYSLPPGPLYAVGI